MNKVLFTDNAFSEIEIKSLRDKGMEIINGGGSVSEDELIQKLKDCSGYIIGGSDKATRRVIESTNLKIIIFYGTGYEDYIDVKAASEKGIAVAYTPHANAYTVAEFTVSLLLDTVKRITWFNSTTKGGAWNRKQVWNVWGKTLGIIGMGHIGSHVARIMHKGFGVNVLYVSRSPKKEIEDEIGAKKVELDELMSSSDMISIHMSMNEDTEGTIGEKELSLIKSHTVLVNAARARLVDGKALSKALKEGRLATAAFDAYYTEPADIRNDEYGLLSLPDDKFIITPHTAFSSKEAMENMNNMVIANLLSFFEGKNPPYLINPDYKK